MVALTCSGSLRLVFLASCFKPLIRDMIVGSASPFFCMSIAKFMRSCVVSLLIGASPADFAGVLGEPALQTQDGRSQVQRDNRSRNPGG